MTQIIPYSVLTSTGCMPVHRLIYQPGRFSTVALTRSKLGRLAGSEAREDRSATRTTDEWVGDLAYGSDAGKPRFGRSLTPPYLSGMAANLTNFCVRQCT
jgi:hypothetical protein